MAIAAQAQAMEAPAVGFETWLEIFEKSRLAAAFRPDEGGAVIEPSQTFEQLFPTIVQTIT